MTWPNWVADYFHGPKLRMRPISIIILAFIAATALLGSRFYDADEGGPRSGGDLLLPVFTNQYFHGSGRCDGCHGHDPTGNANRDSEGNELSPLEFWRSTMMANSSKDPYWKAKVRHEVIMNPGHRAEIEDKCASCHAPMGRYTYHLSGAGPFPMDSLKVDSLAMDGVSCMSCHRQDSIGLGSNHSGVLHYMADPMEFGPYEKPFQAAMQNFAGLTPYYSEHIRKAGVCAGCHSLLTNTLDLNGNPTGTTFVEQATYHEWLNSSYSQSMPGSTCQTCHMRRIDENVIIAANIAFLPTRTPYPLHEQAGGNVFMLNLMRSNIDSLGIIANEQHFDRTIAATEDMLRAKAIDLDVSVASISNDTLRADVRLQNKTGHKFPSGYPSRRAFIRFDVVSSAGDTLFSSGRMNSDFELMDEDADYESHHNTITSTNQVQIYEMVMGDVNAQVTHVLELADQHLKDNRIPPVGFTTLHTVYDTTQIVGNATTDADFNLAGTVQGSGRDLVHYNIPLDGFTGQVNVYASLYFQSVPPNAVSHMFQSTQEDIDQFRDMYNAADRSPFLMVTDSLVQIDITDVAQRLLPGAINLFPNPTRNGLVQLRVPAGISILSMELFDLQGRSVQNIKGDVRLLDLSALPRASYLLLINTNSGRTAKRVILGSR